jgi:hypothetical protein
MIGLEAPFSRWQLSIIQGVILNNRELIEVPLINANLRALGIQQFPRTKDGGGAPKTPVLFSFRIAMVISNKFATLAFTGNACPRKG